MTSAPPLILHVEDSLDHARLVACCLERSRVVSRIQLVEDGETALDYLLRRGKYRAEENSPRPRVILLDLRLPKIDGLEVLRTIKANPELLSIPVVVLTSSEADRDLAEAYLNHGNSYLVKPMDFATLRRQMDDFAEYWLDWNRPEPPADGTERAA